MAEQTSPLLRDYEISEKSGNDHFPPYSDELGVTSKSSRVSLRWLDSSNGPDWSVFSKLKPLLPRFLQPGGLRRRQKLHATSYIDALRGYAAWVVMNSHRWDFRTNWFLSLPFINTIYSGLGMVDVFFVISGFVLSQRMLKQMRSGQKSQVADSLASSVFRRYLRLYLSAGIASFMAMVLLSVGWMTEIIPRRASFFGQLWHWLNDMAQFCNPFENVTSFWSDKTVKNEYIGPLWTIPVEFRGSMIVFLFCAGTARLRSRDRMILCSLITVVAFLWQMLYVSLFLSGVLIAEISLIRHPERYASAASLPVCEETEKSVKGESLRARIGYTCAFLFALFLLGRPSQHLGMTYFPWQYLEPLAPLTWDRGTNHHFWSAIASPILIYSVDSCLMLQKPFNWNFSQYLGDISFGIYVVHLPIILTLHRPIFTPFVKKYLNYSIWGFLAITILNWFICFWVADYFTRIDKRVVRFGRWLQTKLFVA